MKASTFVTFRQARCAVWWDRSRVCFRQMKSSTKRHWRHSWRTCSSNPSVQLSQSLCSFSFVSLSLSLSLSLNWFNFVQARRRYRRCFYQKNVLFWRLHWSRLQGMFTISTKINLVYTQWHLSLSLTHTHTHIHTNRTGTSLMWWPTVALATRQFRSTTISRRRPESCLGQTWLSLSHTRHSMSFSSAVSTP